MTHGPIFTPTTGRSNQPSNQPSQTGQQIDSLNGVTQTSLKSVTDPNKLARMVEENMNLNDDQIKSAFNTYKVNQLADLPPKALHKLILDNVNLEASSIKWVRIA